MPRTPNNDHNVRTVAKDRAGEPETHHGFRPFASRGTVVSDELLNRLRDKIGA